MDQMTRTKPSKKGTEHISCDVLIVGAGPGGCATAISLADSGLNVVLIDKDVFPRDKVCGDALSPDVLAQLSNLNGDLKSAFESRCNPQKETVVGVRLIASNRKQAILRIDRKKGEQLVGWTAKRIDFDNFMFEEARRLDHVRVIQGEKVNDISRTEDGVTVETAGHRIQCALLIGADGAHSVVSKQLIPVPMDRKHYCGGVRAYYKNVSGMHADGMIELHYYKGILPGYLWIFPLPNGEANVGLGMLSSHISRHKVNLRERLLHLIETEPELQKRFAGAKPIDKVRGFGLPLGSKKRPLSGARVMVIGDAAALIDPVTGEGVGNAIRSGRMAAKQAMQCFEQQDFSAETMRAYDKRIYGLVWSEMQFSRFMQLAFRYPAITNFVTGLAANSTRFNHFLDNAITDAGFWGDAMNPRRWLKHWRNSNSQPRT